MNKVTRRLNNSFVGCKKKLYKGSTNSPYISGDVFAQLCNIQIKTDVNQNLDSIKEAKSIFCESHFLEEFLEEFKGILTAKVIFAGNSDREFHDINFKWPRSLKRIYIQNSFVSDSKRVFTLPIGLENRSLGSNGVGAYNVIPYSFSENRILMGPYGDTHNTRREIDKEFKMLFETDQISYLSERQTRSKYKKILKTHNIVGSPRGNGVDTHRIWETIYYGRYPILASSSWTASLDYLDIPKLVINNWSIDEVKKVLSKTLQRFNPKRIDSIWEPYWQKIIKDL
jgi:hypothetical protein